jgi:hypothetical protein
LRIKKTGLGLCVLGLCGLASIANGCGALVGLTDLPPTAGSDASAPDASEASASDAADASAVDASDSGAPDASDSGADSSVPVEAGTDAAADGCSFEGLEAYYPLSGDTVDHSGNNGIATATSTSFADGGMLGELALLFPENGDGGGAGTFAINQPDYQFSNGATLCTWFDAQPVTVQSYGLPLFVGGPRFAGDFFSLQVQNGFAYDCADPNEIFHDHWGGHCDGVSLVAPTQRWNYVCIALVPTEGPLVAHIDVFLNGQLSPMPVAAYTWRLSQVTVGSNTIDGTSTMPSFLGMMNEVSIWSRSLTVNEMEGLYNGGQGCKPRP